MSRVSLILQSRVAKNGLWMVALQGFNMVIPLLTLPYITRILSSSSYGEFSVALNWVSYFQVLVEYGFNLTGARRAATHKNSEQLDEVHSNIICSRFFLFCFCLVIYLLVILLTSVDATQIICMTILFLMVFSTIFQQNWFFQGIAEMKNITIINVISRTISVILIFLLVKQPSDLYMYCFLYISNFLISSLVGCFVVRFKYNVSFFIASFSTVLHELREGWPLFVSSAMSTIFGGIGITILDFYATKDVVGIYSAINKIPYVLTILFAAVSQAIYPFVCKSFESSFENGLRDVRKYGIPVLCVFLSLGFVVILLNYPIVIIAFGSEYAEYSKLLIPFIIWVSFGIINNLLGIQTLVASGHQKEYSNAFLVSFLVMLCLMMFLGRLLGPYGVAYASMISEMVLTVILLLMIGRIDKCSPSFNRPKDLS